jgi:hypothetical protein
MTVRLAFGALLIVATALLYVPTVQGWLKRGNAITVLLWLFVLSRLAGWALAYVVVDDLVRSSDLAKYYFPEAGFAMSGQVAYRDFGTSYGPFFPYLAGLLLPVWHHRAAVALVMIAFEIGAVLLFTRCVTASDDAGRDTMARTLFVYMLNPAALYWDGMIAYNSSIVLFFWVVGVIFVLRLRYAASLLALAGSVLAGKILGLLVVPAWLAHPRRRYLVLAGFAVLAFAIVAGARQIGVDLLVPLQREGNRSTAGNIWFLSSAIVPFSAEGAAWRFAPPAALLLATGALALWLSARWRQPPSAEQFCAAIAAIGWLFMILSKKTYPHYLPMFLLFWVFAIAAVRSRSHAWAVALASACAVGILEPGLWNALRQPAFLPAPWTGACGQRCYALVAADAVLLAASGYFLVLSVRAAAPRPRSVPART